LWRGQRSILDLHLGYLGDVTALQPLEHGQAEVDAGGHSAAGDPITVDHHSVLARGRTKKLEQTQVGPVGGGLVRSYVCLDDVFPV